MLNFFNLSLQIESQVEYEICNIRLWKASGAWCWVEELSLLESEFKEVACISCFDHSGISFVMMIRGELHFRILWGSWKKGLHEASRSCVENYWAADILASHIKHMLKHICCVLCLSPVFSSGRNWWELLPKWIALDLHYLLLRLEMLTSLGAFTPCSSLYNNTKYFPLLLETMEFWIDYFQASSISN